MQNIWKISEDLAELNRFKAFNKKYPREYAACFSNLKQVEETLVQLALKNWGSSDQKGRTSIGSARPE